MTVMRRSHHTLTRKPHNRFMPEERSNVLAFPQAHDAIELRHLRAFVAVADELNFSRAADRLHISQSALSRQISGLEKLLGCDLLRRSTHRVELTVPGEALLERTQQLLTDVDQAVAATQLLGGELAFRLTQIWAPVFAAAEPGIGLEERRAAIEGLYAQFPPPPEAKIQHVNAAGIPAFKIGPRPELEPTFLYVHGGGHVFGSAWSILGVAGALAMAADAPGLVPEFRLAPENPFPAELDDVKRAYRWMLGRGIPPERITVAGDSSGGGTVMALLHDLKAGGEPLPGGVLLFCPFVDLSGSSLKARAKTDEAAQMVVDLILPMIEDFLGGQSLDDPRLSPLTDDLTGLPPMLIQGATADPHLEDAHLLAQRAQAHGVEARLELYPVDTHAFQVFWSFLPEAREAIEKAGEFVGATATGRGYSAAGVR